MLETDNDSKAVKVRVSVSPRTSLCEQIVALRLYMHDQRLADVPAALVAEAKCTLPAVVEGSDDANSSSELVIMNPDLENSQQNGKRWNEMIQPSLYVAIDNSESSVTYTDGPVFGIQPGSEVTLKLEPKTYII
jgi:hypothetical protein